jgi:hypothetical protein
MIASRWMVRFFFVAAAAIAVIEAAVSAEVAALSEALDKAETEEDATKLLEPFTADLKKLDSQVMEKVVLRQWWTLARDLVAKSHTQQVDLSFAVRKAVRTLKDEADELLRTLNPKYGMAQQVSPSFQWAQNDTCIFLTVKYTVRWNAPGALEVTEPSVNMTDHSFNFSGLGKHSNNKYRYTLGLNLFDNIDGELSQWSAASVGKLSVTLRKKWARKWPRLLGDKKLKISNMHVWMEMQEKLDASLGGMTSVSNSPVTCAGNEKLYCLATDTCKKPANCTQCPGKSIPKLEANLCAGVPGERATLSFSDDDPDENQIGGEIKIFKARNEFDIDKYTVYFGKDQTTKLSDEAIHMVGEAAPAGGDVEVKIPLNTAIPDQATHLLVYSSNEYGEYSTPGSSIITDAVLPKEKPVSIEFTDQDGERGSLSGTVSITGPESGGLIDEYALHWGKSPTRKTQSASLIRNVPKGSSGNVATHHITKGTKIPDGATHMLAYSKNKHGDHPTPVALKIVDKSKPCVNKTDVDCPTTIAVQSTEADIQISFSKAASEETVDKYALYWGRRDCSGGGQTGAKNGHIKDIEKGAELQVTLPADTAVPGATTHILVFTKSGLGESNHCASASFVKETDKKEL